MVPGAAVRARHVDANEWFHGQSARRKQNYYGNGDEFAHA
jgi:hypothetical protein